MKFTKTPVRILSLCIEGSLRSFGSENYQELILLARLADAGVKSIYLAIVDPDYSNAYSYLDLLYFLKKNEACLWHTS